jgi:hypothetical protein
VALSSIEIWREAGHDRDRLRRYRVAVDGVQVGSVRAGETAVFPVEPGVHRVQISIAWCRSPTAEVEVPERGTVRLGCRPNPDLASALKAITTDRGRYIELSELPARHA